MPWNIYILWLSFKGKRVRFMIINLSETFCIVGHQLSNATMCICGMISVLFHTPPKLVIVQWAIAISSSVLLLFLKTKNKTKKNGEQEQKTTIEYSSFIQIFLHHK